MSEGTGTLTGTDIFHLGARCAYPITGYSCQTACQQRKVRADLANRVWAGAGVDGQWNPLANLPLARIYHPDWGSNLSLILTAESENAYPGSTNPIVTQWTTEFKDPKLYRLD